MKKTWVCGALLIGSCTLGSGSGQAVERAFSLEGRVITVRLIGERSVPVVLTGPDIRMATVTDEKGFFRFEVAPGVYDLEVGSRASQFTFVELSRIKVDRKPSRPLLVLRPWITSSGPLRPTGPTRVPAPDLEVAFVPSYPIRQGGTITGRFIVRNMGKYPLELPFRTLEDRDRKEQLVLDLYVFMEAGRGDYRRTLACIPGLDCQILQPGEWRSLPAAIADRKELNRGNDRAKTFRESGILSYSNSFVLWSPGWQERSESPQDKYSLWIERR